MTDFGTAFRRFHIVLQKNDMQTTSRGINFHQLNSFLY